MSSLVMLENVFILKMANSRTVKTVTGSHNRTSNYIGVNWKTSCQKWLSSVTDKGTKYECGYHDSERDAAKARDRKILALNIKKPLQVLKPVSK